MSLPRSFSSPVLFAASTIQHLAAAAESAARALPRDHPGRAAALKAAADLAAAGQSALDAA